LVDPPDVVLNYPERARGNAVDFHIMQSLQTWAPMPSIISTADIVRDFPQFLAIEQSGRAWFHNLGTTRDIVAEKLAEVTSADGEQTCTLWKVTSVKPRS
jgi:putative heme iron utilization protein